MTIQEFESQEALDDAFDRLMEKEQEKERLKSIKPTASLSWSLDIECPKCHRDIDLADHDEDGVYSRPIFNNTWDDLEGEEVECPHCDHWFEIGAVEY